MSIQKKKKEEKTKQNGNKKKKKKTHRTFLGGETCSKKTWMLSGK